MHCLKVSAHVNLQLTLLPAMRATTPQLNGMAQASASGLAAGTATRSQFAIAATVVC